MTLPRALKLPALALGVLLAIGAVVWLVARRGIWQTGAQVAAVLQTHLPSPTGDPATTRNIRFPLYEGNSRVLTTLMLGQTAEPLEGGRYLISGLRIENYSQTPSGPTTNYVIEAPKCLLDPSRKVASSDGRMFIRSTDGNFMTTGIGFEWRHLDSHLTISNEVLTHVTRPEPNPPPKAKP